VAPRILESLVERIGEAEGLDKPAKPLANAVSKINPPGRMPKDLLSGTWLGHPLHPLLTDIPIGAWASALVLDLFGGDSGERAADQLVGLGAVAALPTAVSGLSDWSDMLGGERRIGFVHALGNVTAVALYGLSYVSRRQGRRGRGLALSLLGASAITLGGYLGGHLTYRRGVNVDRHAWHEGSEEWIEVAQDAELEEGTPVAVPAGEDVVLVCRRGGQIQALSDVCSHAGGPLHEGQIDEQDLVTCPWHGSTFRLDDGKVVHGPATGPQPVYDVRIDDGKVLVRRRS
jgi:nitrite reductase/ring-hydroxylating ferredoxin subunit/uncharacterized membrane protein